MSIAYEANDRRKGRKRICCSGLVTLALLGLLAAGTLGCNEDEAWDAFRSASRSSLEAGMNDIMDGVVSGLFAIYDLGTDEDSSSGSSSSN